MASLRARTAHYLVSWRYADQRASSVHHLLEGVRDEWHAQTAPDHVPGAEQEEQFRGSSERDAWQVFHIAPRSGEVTSDKVVVYWHGGAFIHRAQHLHWTFVQKLADQLGCRVLVPIYTLAPLATGTSCIQTCLELLAHTFENTNQDARYAGKRIVLAGDSAGGWIALRVLLALIERTVGKRTSRDREDHVTVETLRQPPQEGDRIDCARILDRVDDVLLISPLVDTRVDRPQDLEAAKRDPWLSKNLFDAVCPLWSYGPAHAFPDFDFRIPQDKLAHPIAPAVQDLPPLDAPQFAPINGLDVMAEYHGMSRIRVTTFVGTHDILCPQNQRKQQRLEALGVKSETHVYEGLFHVFPLLAWLPESTDVFEKIRALF